MICTILLLIILALAYYIFDWILRSLKVGNVTDKYVFITGCDSGFGRGGAIRLDSLGFHVFAGCLTEDGAKCLSESCSSRLVTVSLDLRKIESIKAAVEVVKEKLPADKGLWALLNNAGVPGLFTLSELCTREDYLVCLSVNLLGMADMTKHVLPLIRKSKGRIVNTGSSAGRLAFCPSPYTMSKFAVEGYSDILRREVATQGISVSVVEPGAFKTNVLNHEKLVKEVTEAYERSSPEVQTVHKDHLEQTYQRIKDMLDAASPDISPVVDAYTHAVTSRYPRTRYVVGSDARLIFIPLSYLPDRLCDFILARLIKPSTKK